MGPARTVGESGVSTQDQHFTSITCTYSPLPTLRTRPPRGKKSRLLLRTRDRRHPYHTNTGTFTVHTHFYTNTHHPHRLPHTNPRTGGFRSQTQPLSRPGKNRGGRWGKEGQSGSDRTVTGPNPPRTQGLSRGSG